VRRLALALVLVALAGCARSQLVIIPAKDLPDNLYKPTGSAAAPRTTTVTLYMVYGTRLAPVIRTGRSSQPLPQVAMTELLRGPSTDELAKGFTTQIPESVTLLDVSIDRGIASVDLSRDYERPAERTAFLLRLAQVVYTLDEFDSVNSVRFLVEGQPVSVMIQNTQLVSEPVARGKYSMFAPRSVGVPVSEEPIGGIGS
jgi:hypothetical protein